MGVERNLARNLLRARELKGLTQKEVSKKTGITEVSISRYETGERIPSSVMLYRLAKCYGVSTDKLLEVDR